MRREERSDATTGAAAEEPSGDAAAPEPSDSSAEALLERSDLTADAGRVREIVVTVTLVLIFLYALQLTRTLVVPLVAALIGSLLLRPVVRSLKRTLHLPETIGGFLVLVAMIATVAGGVSLLGGPVGKWRERAPSALTDIRNKLQAVRAPAQEIQETAETIEGLTKLDDETPKVKIEGPSLGATLVSGTQDLLGGISVTLLLLYFLLASGDNLVRKLVDSFERFEDKKRALEIVRAVESDISRYLLTISAINVALGISVGLSMWALDVPNPILWGAVAALLNFIPYLGAWITAAILVCVSLLSFDSVTAAALPVAAFVVLTTSEAYLVSPLVLGQRLLLSPVAVLTAVLCFAWAWGAVGALLAVPILVVARVVSASVPSLQTASRLLGP